jgi:hypothetical protein
MKKKTQQLTVTQNDFQVNLTLHDFPADLVEQFALQIAQPFYLGSLTEAVKDMMQRAVAEQEFLQNRIQRE